MCVVGLGGSGLAAIDEFLRLGATVVGVDAGVTGGAAAGRNGGLLRAGTALFHHEARARYGAQRAKRMYAATIEERERILGEMPDIARRCGYLRLAHDDSEEADCRTHLDALRADGFGAEWFGGDLGSGLLVPDDAAIDPRERCRREAESVASRGARLFEHSAALELRDGLVVTTGGRVHCHAIVVAVDGALADVLPELAGCVWPVRLQMLASGPHEPGVLPHAVGTRWGWDYAQQLPDGRIAFGGCRDVGGDGERTTDAVPTTEVQQAIERRFTEVTGLDAIITHRWAATVGYTTSGLPVLDEIRPRVWATGAYSGTGNLLGAVCGRAAARVAGGASNASPID
jgi:gamma-glutamylputrescine oxidase